MLTRIPLSYYIIVPRGGFAEIETILAGKTSNISIPQRKAIREYLMNNGQWTDKNQFENDNSRDFKYWTLDGKPRVIVEEL